jgi:1-acyl-sn-glycerol-3-phosphate acyltransferase
MAKCYHRAVWSLLKDLYSPSLLKRNRVEASGIERLPAPPFILMADHANALDPYVLGSFSRNPIRYMANIEGVHPLKALLAELVGAYPRRKGASDLAALRATFELSRSGDAIGLFPEGDRSWDGSSSAIKAGAGKLARRLGVPLVLARQKGNYLAHPRWASRLRRGSWSVDFLVYDADELGRMGDALADAVIAAALAKNEIKDAQREPRRFECEASAEGIGRLIWRCPVCGKADSIIGRGNEIRCLRCGSRWEIDANCRVRALNVPLSLHAAEIADLKDWHDWQVATLPELADATDRGGSRLRSEGVVLSRRYGAEARRVGRGLLYLKGSGAATELVFEGDSGRRVFEASAVRGFVDNFNDFSEFDHRGQRWRLRFGGGNAAKWAYALGGSAIARRPGEAA